MKSKIICMFFLIPEINFPCKTIRHSLFQLLKHGITCV
uniref:Uncharacterized protein n=1 Tax=Anguilla anguilla TaxID=7936 RepID=A0A0E9PEU1_ANGAN